MRLKFCACPIVFFSAFLLLIGTDGAAQCTDRYLDTIFTSIDSMQNVVYTTTAGGAANTQLLDIYQPDGDTAALRRMIIWTHGGSFFEGSKNDGDIELLCHRYAQRGYVCASINYRLATSVLSLYDSLQDFKYMIWAFSDLKAAIRYFKMGAAQGNPLKIDTNMIYIGGSSAGAIASDFVADMDSMSLLPASFRAIVDSNGGIEGNSGNPGYSTKPYALASLAGAVNNLDWINSTTPPAIMCQGTADAIVPYDCAYAFSGYTIGLLPTIKLCGSGSMAPQYAAEGVRYSLLSFPGSNHVPWDTNAAIANRMDSAVAAFFYTLNCPLPQGITSIANYAAITISPNPAEDKVQIKLSSEDELSSLTLCDYTGRIVRRQRAQGREAQLSVSGLTPGVYLLQVEMNGESTAPLTEKVVVE